MGNGIDLLETETYCGCWWYWGVNHPDRADCWPFLFECEVADTFAVTHCLCCRRNFLISDMMIEPGDDSVGLSEVYLCRWCASEECTDTKMDGAECAGFRAARVIASGGAPDADDVIPWPYD